MNNYSIKKHERGTKRTSTSMKKIDESWQYNEGVVHMSKHDK